MYFKCAGWHQGPPHLLPVIPDDCKESRDDRSAYGHTEYKSHHSHMQRNNS